MNEDPLFLQKALSLARRGVGWTSPNPPVGAVVVAGGNLVGAGWHKQAGAAHAEVEAIAQAGEAAKGATLYVTLEPCSTHGRTPPCTDLILARGIRRVVIGCLDPNPAHAGRGVKLLEEAGLSVTIGVCHAASERLIRPFRKWIVEKRPWVIWKTAQTLDGRLTLPKPDGRWITSPASLRVSHQLRREVDAILIGAATLRHDNPALTARRGKRVIKVPWRVVLTRSGDLPEDAKLFRDGYQDRTLVYKDEPLEMVLSDLAARGILTLLIEGGGDVAGSFLDAGLVDEVALFLAPWISGGGTLALGGEGAASIQEAWTVRGGRVRQLGPDLFLRGELVRRGAT